MKESNGAGAQAPWGKVGLGLILVFWPFNWFWPGLRTHVGFFFLWLGYVLVVDAWTLRRTGTSPIQRSARHVAQLFLLSVPLWWVFELCNLRLRNWEYVGREHFGDLSYFLLCSLAFSTVMPAVLGTAELCASLGPVQRMRGLARLSTGPRWDGVLFTLGLAMLFLTFAWPGVFFPLVWVSGVFLLEAVCSWRGRRTLSRDLRAGDWRSWTSLWVAGLVCGFFWEMWNLHSYPKWIYHIPFVAEPKLFEMPWLGYLGYLPFALELHLFRELLWPEKAR